MSDNKDIKPTDEQPNEDGQAVHTNNDEKKARFSHLSQAAKVVSGQKQKGWLGLAVAIAVLLLIFFLMISGHHKKTIKSRHTQLSADNDGMIQANVHTLHRLQAKKPQVPKQPMDFMQMLPSFHQDQETKAMIARRNAPSRMYDAGKSSTMVTNPGSTQASQAHTFAGQGAFAQFANGQSTTSSSVTATKIQHPDTTIVAGEFIHAALETAINSDLPGMVRAVVTNPVYAYAGEKPLIPAGSRLIGQYASQSSNGNASERVFVMWNRLITPNGLSIMINSPSNDSLGRAGVGADSVDSHFWKIFGTATLLSVMGATSANAGVGSDEQPNSADMYRQTVASAFQQAAQSTLSQNLNIKPTIHVHQGDSITVFVAHDLDLYNVLG